jgi:S1-C subfamily serine protease
MYDPIHDPFQTLQSAPVAEASPTPVPAGPRPRHGWGRRLRRAGMVVAALGVTALGVGGWLTVVRATTPTPQAEKAEIDPSARDRKPAQAQPDPSSRTDLSSEEQQTIELFRKASPAVVYITTTQSGRNPMSLDVFTIPSGTGSGFVWDDDGHIVTNYHVVHGSTGFRVTLADRSTWDAKLVGAAPHKDIAVLQIQAPADKLEALPVGASDNLLVGQHVLAIGNPFGLDHTLSTGVISGLGREIRSPEGRPISGVVQTDAAINPGNSGGPLLDSRGRLIGMNTAIFSPSGASAGIGFAVPVDTIRNIVPQLIDHGSVVRPAIGIEIADESVARRAGAHGVLVMGVMPGSGAEKAGMRPTERDGRTGEITLGDVIVGLDGKTVSEPKDLYEALESKNVGDDVTVTVEREGKRVDLSITLQKLES